MRSREIPIRPTHGPRPRRARRSSLRIQIAGALIAALACPPVSAAAAGRLPLRGDWVREYHAVVSSDGFRTVSFVANPPPISDFTDECERNRPDKAEPNRLPRTTSGPTKRRGGVVVCVYRHDEILSRTPLTSVAVAVPYGDAGYYHQLVLTFGPEPRPWSKTQMTEMAVEMALSITDPGTHAEPVYDLIDERTPAPARIPLACGLEYEPLPGWEVVSVEGMVVTVQETKGLKRRATLGHVSTWPDEATWAGFLDGHKLEEATPKEDDYEERSWRDGKIRGARYYSHRIITCPEIFTFSVVGNTKYHWTVDEVSALHWSHIELSEEAKRKSRR